MGREKQGKGSGLKRKAAVKLGPRPPKKHGWEALGTGVDRRR